MQKRVCLLILFMAVLSGCSINPPQTLGLPGQPQGSAFVKDNRQALNYPGFLAGEGNIYSCHYGIAYLGKDLLTPDPLSILEYHLAQHHPDIATRNVTLNRFDIFYNWKEPLMGVAKNAAAGALTGATGDSWTARQGPMTGPVIGCEDEELGEYYRSEVPIGNPAMVTYLELVVDDRSVKIRNVSPIETYEMLPKNALAPLIDDAILDTLKLLDEQLTETLE